MMNAISKLTVLALILLMLASGCKSKKKAMEASNAAKEKARIEQAEALRKQQEEERMRLEAEERAKREAEVKRNAEEVLRNSPETRLSQYFQSISTAGTVTAANASINEALTLFASPDTPVLIVISEEGGQKDYDQPTTIKAYLHYLKDQKKNINAISSVKTDSAGKIMELELRKN